MIEVLSLSLKGKKGKGECSSAFTAGRREEGGHSCITIPDFSVETSFPLKDVDFIVRVYSPSFVRRGVRGGRVLPVGAEPLPHPHPPLTKGREKESNELFGLNLRGVSSCV
jgi:hypothetical protein